MTTGEEERAHVLGVVVVTYGSADVVLECLESLLATPGRPLRVVVVDNASPDGTVEAVRAWASGAVPFERPASSPLAGTPPVPKPLALREATADEAPQLAFEELADVTLVHAGGNRGFAGGVNVGLATLAPHAEVGLFWILNPDCVTAPTTAAAYLDAARAVGPFALMGCRTVFYDPADRIQTDGGRLRAWTGAGWSVHRGEPVAETAVPDAATLDYVSGANVVASRAFVERVGPMAEDYFLYYEEVDWAFRRDDLPLVFLGGGVVHHHGGTSIGSATWNRASTPFSTYFLFRNRMRFVRRFRPSRLVTSYLYGAAKIVQFLLRGDLAEAGAAFRAQHGLGPPRAVRERVAPEARPLAFGPATERRTES